MSLTKNPMNPMMANPIAVAIAIFWNSFLSGLVHLFTSLQNKIVYNQIMIKLRTNERLWRGIVLFKSLRNSKRRKKGNFTSKSNSNKIKLCRGGGNIILFKIRFQRYNFIIWVSLQFLSELNNIFHVKGLKDLLFMSN